MSISINKAFKALSADKYNKMNILVFMLFTAIFFSIYICTEKVLAAVFFFLYSITVAGYSAIVNYNEIQDKENVFPSISNFFNIMFNGIKYSGGLYLLNLIFYIPLSLILMLLTIFMILLLKLSVNDCFILSIVLFLIFYTYFTFKIEIPAMLMFFENLNFKTFFTFKQKEFLEDRKGFYIQYILKSTVANLIIVLIFTIPFILMNLLSSVFAEKINILLEILFPIVLTVIITIMTPITLIVQANLNAQFINLPKTRQTYNW